MRTLRSLLNWNHPIGITRLLWQLHLRGPNMQSMKLTSYDMPLVFSIPKIVLTLRVVERFALRFGAESLERAMNGLRTFENNLSAVVPDFHTCDVKDIKSSKTNRCSDSTVLYRIPASGVGPWRLFLGPIKVILGVQDRFWGDPNIDSIILPTGVEA